MKGGGTPGYACYGATKRGLPQLTDSLVKELDEGVQGYEKKSTPGTVQVHNLSPGMVFTKLLLDDSTPELRKFPFGVLAAQPEEVAADLVPKILDQKSNGGSVEFLTIDRILKKFYERFILQEKVRKHRRGILPRQCVHILRPSFADTCCSIPFYAELALPSLSSCSLNSSTMMEM